jgi:hypothetical protein
MASVDLGSCLVDQCVLTLFVLDGQFDGDEEEEDAVVNQVLDEIGLQIGQQVRPTSDMRIPIYPWSTRTPISWSRRSPISSGGRLSY